MALAIIALYVCLPINGTLAPVIIGGEDVKIHEYPATVSLKLYGRSHFCGGTIIGSKWVLTAAHCVEHFLAMDITLNANATYQDLDGLHDYTVKTYTINPHYEFPYNDIAVIETQSDLTHYSIATIRVSNVPIGSIAHTVGWGHYDNTETVPSHLQYTDGIISHPSLCQTSFDGIICFYSGVSSTVCRGDSGTGLYDNDDNLIGITSYTFVDANNDCLIGSEDGFSDATYYITFICDTTNNEANFVNNQCNLPRPPFPPLSPPFPHSPPNSPPSPSINEGIFIIVGSIVGIVVIGVILTFCIGYQFKRSRELST